MAKVSRRQFIGTSVGAGVMMSIPGCNLRPSRYVSANDSVNVGLIGCGSRAGKLAEMFSAVDGVNISGLCDPDSRRVASMKEQYGKAETWNDLRGLLDSKNVDAVVIATCNHWHCLAAIWAMQAGKDVYVEKPLSHSQWEGEQTVAAARKLNRICQVGTQQRSDPIQAKIKEFLHEEKGLGEIQACRVNRYGVRPAIGKRDTPLEIDENVAYDLWLGPAQDKPIFRNKLHYDWHWDWNTGSGEMGNWGVHVLDDVRNTVFQDQVTLPKKIFAGGGRVAVNDAGETPNVNFVYFDTGSYPVVIGLSNLPAMPGRKNAEPPPGRKKASPQKGRKKAEPKKARKKPAPHPGPDSGYIVYCEGGRYEGQRGGGAAFDNDGKKIKSFEKSTGDTLHQKNFIEAVRKQDASILNADVEVGNYSTGWSNLANIAVRAGGKFSSDEAREIDLKQWNTLLDEMQAHTAVHGIKLDSDQIRMSPMLEIDTDTERFVGDSSAAANSFIKREYRKGYEVPELAAKVMN